MTGPLWEETLPLARILHPHEPRVRNRTFGSPCHFRDCAWMTAHSEVIHMPGKRRYRRSGVLGLDFSDYATNQLAEMLVPQPLWLGGMHEANPQIGFIFCNALISREA